MVLVFIGASFAAGYGVPVDGYPSLAERQLLLWTNAARVDPTEFTSDYSAGGCSTDDFSADEKTAQAPLYIDLALTEVAREHSTDMAENGCFQHESCDGTDTWTRIGAYYAETSMLGENIAYGSSDARYTVLSMWMCSHDGHRGNIMSASFDEMGPGADSSYWTQDFAGGGVLPDGKPPVRMATDYSLGVYADWGDSAAPASIDVVIEGDPTPLELEYGEADNGIYAVTAEMEAGTRWYIQYETQAGVSGTFPAEGSFEAGGDDWTETREDAAASDGDGKASADDLSAGCSTSAQAPGLAGLLALGLLRGRGRRRR